MSGVHEKIVVHSVTEDYGRLESGDELVVKEQSGSYCCLFVPNCFPKTHHMKKVGEGKWQGTSGCKTISITKISDDELSHLTTDGYFTLTRPD